MDLLAIILLILKIIFICGLVVAVLVPILFCIPIGIEMKLSKSEGLDGIINGTWLFGILKISQKLPGTSKIANNLKENEKTKNEEKTEDTKSDTETENNKINLMSYIRKYNSKKELLTELINFLEKSIKKIDLRNVEGTAYISFSDPYMYGYASAVLVALTPSILEKVDVTTDWGEDDFTFDISAKGYITPMVYVTHVHKLIFSKSVKEVLLKLIFRKDG